LGFSTRELVDLVNSNSRAVAYDLVEPLNRFLTVSRELCDGDLEQVLLMVVISLRSSLHPDFRSLDEADLNRLSVLPGFGTNMRSLAESTGIPRETVRRKVANLVERAWVVPRQNTLYYSTDGYRCVGPARDAIIRMHVRGFEVVGALTSSIS
jgi:hypothetical protein